MTRNGEEILVVPRKRLLPELIHGFTRDSLDKYLERVRAHGEFRSRTSVEHDPAFKQIIPYLIVRHQYRLFLFQRSTAGSEARLQGKYSIGVGGHVNRRDVEGSKDVIVTGLERELTEELVIDGKWRARLVGVLNDDTVAVGRVHFGLVHVVDVDSVAVSVRESGAFTGRLARLQDVLSVRERMETWSQLILEAADPTTL